MRDSSAARKILKSAGRWARDVVTWRRFEISGESSSARYMEVLGIAFENMIASDRLLKSQMGQSWSKVCVSGSPSQHMPTLEQFLDRSV